MELFELIYDPKKDKGVYSLSIVSDPAMEGMFVAFNKDEKPESFEIEFAEVNKEKRILVGLALEPNKPIYRNQDGHEFDVFLSTDTVEKVAHDFVKNQHVQNSSIEHSQKIDGVSVVESWTVIDEANDKSNHYGLNAKKGSWICSMKIDNDEVWNDYVKTGLVKGFSIDGLFTLNKIELTKNNTMADKTLAQEIKEGFAELKALFSGKEKETETKEDAKSDVKMGSAKLEDGTEVQYESETIEVGTALFVVAEDGETMPAPDGEHTLEDGSIVVTVDGLVTELKPKADEDEAAKEQAELKEMQEMLKVLQSEFKTAKAGFETSLSERDAKIIELETQLSATPATKPKKHTSVELSNDKPLTLAEVIKNSRK